MPRDNIIIMTTGSSGSSVLAGTIGQKGYWLGEETKKLKFDTYENAELVDLDREILRLSGFSRYDCNDIPCPIVEKLFNLPEQIDCSRYQAFVDKCNAHSPWLWKDPRISFTIHFWSRLIDLDRVKFIFIERNPRQSYAGLILKRRVPMSYAQHNLMNENYRKSCQLFLKKYHVDCLQIIFEDLLTDHEKSLRRLGEFLEIELNVSDLKKIYKGDLSRNRWTGFDYFRAHLLYIVYRYLRKDYIRFPRID